MSGAVGDTIAFQIPFILADFSPYFLDSDFKQENEGGFADVYGATLGKTKFALKVLRRFSHTDETELRKNFNFEMRAWIKLGSHPNILELVAICYSRIARPEGQPCFLSAWQENGEVTNYLKKNSDADLLKILQGILAGLMHMHERGVIHGDLRGGNILVSRDGVPKISDFGLSKLCGKESSTSGCSGTLRWMARELLEADSSASGPNVSARRSKKSDIWSAGMTILELLSGEHPYFEYKSDPHVVQVIAVRGELPKLPGFMHSHWQEYESFLMTICRMCWSRDPSHRPDAEELLSKIRNFESLNSVDGDEDVEDQSLTPRAHPHDKMGDLLANIEVLNLSSPTENFVDADKFPLESNSPETKMETAVGRTDDLRGKTSGMSETCLMSYMTAFSNHIAASKKFRKHLVRSDSCGPDHAPTWTVTITIDDQIVGVASGPSKRLAQEDAAKQAYAVLENETVSPKVKYLPVFMNRLNVRGLRDQFRWRTEVYGNWSGNQPAGYVSTLYRMGIVVGRGRGCSPKIAEGEAARAASTALSF